MIGLLDQWLLVNRELMITGLVNRDLIITGFVNRTLINRCLMDDRP